MEKGIVRQVGHLQESVAETRLVFLLITNVH
jgi:hypothetical protein